MMHTAAIIAAAREKKRFLALPLFDGTDENGAEDSSIVISELEPACRDQVAGALGAAKDRRATGVLRSPAEFDITPTYEVGMRYWENGVADEMLMDFGDFVMAAKMSSPPTPQPHRC